MKANFGLGIATGTEGLMYPIPYSSARDVVDLSVYAEKLGFHSVWGNDHITTQNYVREEFANKPPRYYAPLLELAAIAERTTTLKLATALLVIPFRNPLVMAKEIATLDQLSKYFTICGMPIAPSQYWPMVHGSTPEDVRKDEEGMQIMRMLGRNMAYMIRAFALARENGLLPPDMEKPKMRTNFIR